MASLLPALLLPLLSACGPSVLTPEGPVAANEKTIMIDALVIMLAIVIPTILIALWFGWWYRESNTKARYLPEWAFSGRLELLVWSIPILVIVFLGGVIWVGSYQLDPFRPLPVKPGVRPVEVQVVSLDWKWLFIYPEQGVASINQVVVPVGTPVHFSMTSASVMNGFFVPRLGGMMATMNGMVSQISLQADKVGDYYGESTQFSGDGFPDMRFTLHSVPAGQFNAWVAQARSAGPVLDLAAYRGLQRQSDNVRPFTFRAVQPNLFQLVANRQAPPGPGPTVGRPGVGPEVSPQKNG